MPITVVAELLFKMLFMVLVGYFIRRRGLIDDAFQKTLSTLLLRVILPINTLVAGNTPYDASLARGLLFTGVFALGYYLLVYLLGPPALRAATRLDKKKQGTIVNLVALANVGFIGFPISAELFGAEGYLYTVIYNFLFNFFAYSFGLALLGGSTSLKSTLLSPMILSCVGSCLLFFAPFRLPGMVAGAMQAVGSMVTPIAMIIVGASLARIPLKSVFVEKWAWGINAVRQLVLPLATALLLRAVGLTGTLPSLLVILTGMPPGTNNVIFAEQTDADISFTTRSVVLGNILMPLGLLWGLYLNHLFF